MSFQNWLNLQESSLQSLYNTTVQAFPKTSKRQHAIEPVKIVELNWIPYLGVKTLYIKGLAESGETEYKPMILFKGIKYHENKDHPNLVELTANDGNIYVFEKIKDNDVLVRCDCKDFHWRFNYYDHADGSLYGRVRKNYDATINPGSANPLELPGMCKHLIKMVLALDHAGILEG